MLMLFLPRPWVMANKNVARHTPGTTPSRGPQSRCAGSGIAPRNGIEASCGSHILGVKNLNIKHVTFHPACAILLQGLCTRVSDSQAMMWDALRRVRYQGFLPVAALHHFSPPFHSSIRSPRTKPKPLI